MAQANPLLFQLQGVKAFILYRLEPQANGDLDKIPTNPLTGNNSHPLDPRTWMLPEEAAAWADQFNAYPLPAGVASYGVGLVISEDIRLATGHRLFCLDLDKCRDGSQWAPHAINFCARFPGAYIETSVSGNGLHVFGVYQGEPPEHSIKNKIYRMELYTRLRFIAITGAGAVGSVFADQTEALVAMARDFFPPRDEDEAEYGDTLSDTPVAAWEGPDDDEELLRRAHRSGLVRAVFGGKAAFTDLFEARADVLARVFPPQKYTAWDESSADLALANHLAFWTGNHGTRMERLMRQSKLVRAKWDQRPKYLINTINRACSSQTQWYKGPKSASLVAGTVAPVVPAGTALTDLTSGAALSLMTPPSIPAANPMQVPSLASEGFVPTMQERAVGKAVPTINLLSIHEQLQVFAGCVYVQDVHQVMMPQGYLLTPERFDTEFSGMQFQMTPDGQRPSKRAWDAFVHSEVYQFPKVKGTFFDPRLPQGLIQERDGWMHVNTFVPIEVIRTPGDVTPFWHHLKRLLPKDQDAEILLAYMAACVQYPGVKFQWWPLIQGVEGNGKTILSELLEYAVGSRYTHWPKADQVGSKFNSAFYGKILILLEDIYISEARGSLWESLKPMITGRKIEIEGKGVDKVTREIGFNGVMNSNHKNGIRKTRNDRRVGPFFCAQQSEAHLARDGFTTQYFIWLRDWMDNRGGAAHVAHYLATYQIPDQLNPAKYAIRAPKTSATEDAIAAGHGAVEQEVIEHIEQGALGFRGGWVSSTALDRLIATMGKESAVPRNKRRELLESLGYSPHPALPDGRSTVLDTDGTRPRLYCLQNTPGASEQNPDTVFKWYQAAQQVTLQ